MSCTMRASIPASHSSRAISLAFSSSLSRTMVFMVAYTLAPKRWAYVAREAMSSMLLPAEARAPNAGGPMYTASAPQSMAVRPVSASRAGDSNSSAIGVIGLSGLREYGMLLCGQHAICRGHGRRCLQSWLCLRRAFRESGLRKGTCGRLFRMPWCAPLR